MSAEAGWHTVNRNKRGNRSNRNTSQTASAIGKTVGNTVGSTTRSSAVGIVSKAVVRKEVEEKEIEGDFNFWDTLSERDERQRTNPPVPVPIAQKKDVSLNLAPNVDEMNLFNFVGLGPKLWRSILYQLGFSRELILFSSTSKIFLNLISGPGGVCDYMWWFYFGEETKSYKEYKYALVAKLKSPQKVDPAGSLLDLKRAPNLKSWSQHIKEIYQCNLRNPKKHIKSLDTIKVLRSLRGNSHASVRKQLFKWALSENLVNYAYFLYVKSGETISRLHREKLLDFNLNSTFDFLFMDMTGTYTFMLESQLPFMRDFMTLLINYYRKRMFEPASDSTSTQNLEETISKIINYDPLFAKLMDYYVRRCSIYGHIDDFVLIHGINYQSAFTTFFRSITDPKNFPFLYTQGKKLNVEWVDLCWRNDRPDFMDFILKNDSFTLDVGIKLKIKELLSNILLLGFVHWWKILVDNKIIEPLLPELPVYLHNALALLQERKKVNLKKQTGHNPATREKYAQLYMQAFRALHQYNPSLLNAKSVGLRNSFLHYNLFTGEVLSYMIGLGMNIENENAKGLTPLQMICYSQRASEKQVRLLIGAGALFEPKNQNLPPLAILMQGSKFSTARYLISRGASPAAAHTALQSCLKWFEIQPRIGKLWELVGQVEELYVELRLNMAVLWALVREGRAELKTTEIVDGKEVQVDVPQWAVAVWKLFHDWMPNEVVRKIVYMIDVII